MIDFKETGLQEVTAIVVEGQDADTVRWVVEVRDEAGTTDNADYTGLPTEAVLYPPSPNPFNSMVKLSFLLPESENVKLEIFNIQGRIQEVIQDDNLVSGRHEFTWNASWHPTGIYFARLTSRHGTKLQKLLLVP